MASTESGCEKSRLTAQNRVLVENGPSETLVRKGQHICL